MPQSHSDRARDPRTDSRISPSRVWACLALLTLGPILECYLTLMLFEGERNLKHLYALSHGLALAALACIIVLPPLLSETVRRNAAWFLPVASVLVVLGVGLLYFLFWFAASN